MSLRDGFDEPEHNCELCGAWDDVHLWGDDDQALCDYCAERVDAEAFLARYE